jgi:hypothetical protein
MVKNPKRRKPLAKVMAALADGKTKRDGPEDLVKELLAARDPTSPVKKALDEFEAELMRAGMQQLLPATRRSPARKKTK